MTKCTETTKQQQAYGSRTTIPGTYYDYRPYYDYRMLAAVVRSTDSININTGSSFCSSSIQYQLQQDETGDSTDCTRFTAAAVRTVDFHD